VTAKPPLFIFTGAHHPTGALIAAYREALLLSEVAEVTLVLARGANVHSEDLPGANLMYLPLAQLRKSLRGLLFYGPALLRSGWHLRRALSRADCTRLQINDYHFLEGAGARLLGYRGQIVTWIRLDPAREPLVYGTMLRLAKAVSDELVAVSNFIRCELPRGLKARLIYDPVADARTRSAVSDSNRLLFIGNYIAGKGQDVAIRAFHRVASEFPEAELVFHGSDMGLEKNRKYRATLQRMADDGLGRGRIHFRGFELDTGALLDDCLAAVNLSRSESFSLTCQEASAHGVAVIATRCGGPEEIIEDGVTGWLVPVDDEAATADAMRQALSNPGETRAMGERGSRLVRQRFGVEPFREALIELFRLPNPGKVR
jgi:L-malate glycosyltransferase